MSEFYENFLEETRHAFGNRAVMTRHAFNARLQLLQDKLQETFPEASLGAIADHEELIITADETWRIARGDGHVVRFKIEEAKKGQPWRYQFNTAQAEIG